MVVMGPMKRMLLDHPSAVLRQLQRRALILLHDHSDLPLDPMLLSWLVTKGVPSWATVQSVRWMGTAPNEILIGSKISFVNILTLC